MSRKSVKTPLIYALEPRLLFDGDLGADVASAIVYRDGNNDADVHEAPAVAPENQRENPRENITFEFHSSRTAIVFIDGGVQDPQTLANAAADVLPDDAQIHILQGDSDGFDQINEILANHDQVDEIHIFGHGKAGEARLGTASLSLETLTTHSDTLAVLKNTLTEDGDILLYGCNIASGEEGGTFIEELAEITAADIAASDDITGAGGDWELEVNTGPIEADVVEASDYQSSLTNPDGVSSMTNVENRTQNYLNTKAYLNISETDKNNGNGFYSENLSSDGKFNYVIALEKSNITSLPTSNANNTSNSSYVENTLHFDFSVAETSYVVSSSQPVASYLVALNSNSNATGLNSRAEIIFEHEILGYYADRYNTLASGSMLQHYNSSYSSVTGESPEVEYLYNEDFANEGWVYPSISSEVGKRWSEGYFQVTPSSSPGADYVWTSNNNTLHMAASNGTNKNGTGDFIRVITKWTAPNSAPTVTSATDVSGSVTELADGHVSENSVTLYEAGYFTIADTNNDSVTVSNSLSSTTHSSNSAFGALTATVSNDTNDGSGQINWTYAVDDSSLDALDEGESYTETWAVTVNDGTADVTQNVTITINGAADPLVVARHDFASVTEGDSVTADTLSGVLHTTNTASQDTGDNLSIQSFRTGSVEGSGNEQSPGADLPGSYGILNIGLNGNYTYTANGDISGLDAGEVVYDFFNYTATDFAGNTDTAVLQITINGGNDGPTISATAVDPAIDEAVDASNQVLSGISTIEFADDTDSSLTITSEANSTVSASSGVTLSSALQNALAAAIVVSDNGDNTASWVLNADGLDLDFLAVGDSITIENVVTATDDQGESVTDTITVTINGTNDAPTGANNTVTTLEDSNYVFQASEFGFSDLDTGDALNRINIESLPTNGVLRFTNDGTNWQNVSAGGNFTKAMIDAGWLRFEPASNENGSPYADFTFKVHDGDEASALSNTMTINVTPDNDAPIITAQTNISGTVTEFVNGDPNEDTGTHTITGSFDIADSDSSSFTLSYEGSVQWASEISTHNSTQTVGTFTLSDQTVDGTGSIDWTYSIADYLIADKITANGEVSYLSLDSGESFAETFTVTIDDGDGETVTQDVVITVNGANDFDAQDDFAVVAEGGLISVGNNANQSVGNPITDAFSTFDAAFEGSESVAVEGVAFNNDGSKLYLLENNGGIIQQHTLSTQFDVSTASAEYTVYNGVNWSRDLVFNTDGTKAFTINPSTDILYEYTLTTPFDIGTMQLAFQKAVSDGQGTNVRPKALDFSTDGTKLFYIDQEGQQIIQENLGTAYDTSTASLAAILDISEIHGIANNWGEGFVVSPDGRKMFAMSEGNRIYEWILHTPNDITTATFIHDRDLSSFGYNLRGLAFSNDGSKLFFANKSSGTTEDVVTFNTSVPFSTFYDEPSHSGDVINTNRDETRDTGGNLDVASIRTGATKGAGTPGTLGTPLPGTYGSLTMHANGRYTYQANNEISNWGSGKVGYDQFNYTINQGDAANGAAHAVLTIKVVAQDDAPTVSQAAVDQTIAELDDASSQDLSRSGTITFADDLDSYLTITGAASATVTAGIGDNFFGTATLPTIPSALQASLEDAFSITDNNDNTASWSLDVSDLDLDFLKYDQTIILDYVVTATDDGGQTVTDTITVTLTGTDDKPVSADVVRDINKNGTYTFVASDFAFSDLDGGVFDTLEINGTSTGTLSDDGTPVSENEIISVPVDYLSDPDYSLTYTPAPGEAGQDYVSLTFRVYSDQYEEDGLEGTGSDASQEHTFTFNVNNSAPTSEDNTVTFTEDFTGAFTNNDFGFSDIDGDSRAHIKILTLPDKGYLAVNGTIISAPMLPKVVDNIPTLRFTPGNNENGDPYTSFTFSVNDGTTDSVSAYTMTINVTSVNDAPSSVPDHIEYVIENSETTSGLDLLGPTTNLFDPDGYDPGFQGGYQTGYQTVAPKGMTFSPDGSKLFVLGDNKLVITYNLTTPWDVSSWTVDAPNLDITADVGVGWTEALAFNDDGTVMIVLLDAMWSDQGSDRLLSYNLSTAYDTSTATFDKQVDIADTSDTASIPGASDLKFSDDGLTMFILERHNPTSNPQPETLSTERKLLKISLSTPWDISSADMSNIISHSFLPNDDGTDIERAFTFNGDGTKLFVADRGNYSTSTGAAIREYSVSTPYDITNLNLEREISLDDEWFNKVIYDVALNNDETKLYISGHGHDVEGVPGATHGGYIYEFDLSRRLTSVFTDPEGDDLTITGIGASSVSANTSTHDDTAAEYSGVYGSLKLGADGSFNFAADTAAADQLDAGDVVTETFTVEVSDGALSTNNNIVFNITGVNDPPTAANNSFTINEDATKTFAASEFNFADVDGDGALDHITIATLPAAGTLTLSGSAVEAGDEIAANQIGNLVFTPVAGENGDPYTSFTFSVNDGTADSVSTYTMTITVTGNSAPTIPVRTAVLGGINELPNGHADENNINLSSSGTFTIEDGDNDVVSVSVTASSTSHSGNTVFGTLTPEVQDNTDDGTGQIGWAYNVAESDLDFLSEGETITETFTITVDDGNGGTISQDVTITLIGAKDIVARDDFAVVEEGAMVLVGTDSQGTDVENRFTGASTTLDIGNIGQAERIADRVDFYANGSNMFVNNDSNARYQAYDLSTPFDISTATLAYNADIKSNHFNGSDGNTKARGLQFNADGTKAFFHSRAEDRIVEYDLDTPYFLNSGNRTFNSSISTLTHGNEGVPVDIHFSADGTKLFYLGAEQQKIFELTLATAFDISSVNSNDIKSFDASEQSSADSWSGFTMSPDGRKAFISTGGNHIYEYFLHSPNDIETAAYVGAMGTNSFLSDIAGIRFSDDGSRMFLTHSASGSTTDLLQRDLAVPFSLKHSTGDHSGNLLSSNVSRTADDGNQLTITSVRTGSEKGAGSPGTESDGAFSVDGAYGTLTLNPDGSYAYTANGSISGLGENEVVYDQFNYTAQDASGDTDIAVLTVTISGANALPSVDTPAVDPSFNEEVDASAQDLVASGTIIFEDGDNTELSITGATSATVTPSNGVTLYADLRQALEAAFSITTDGNTATWTLNVQDLDLDFLDVGDSITLEYDVTAEDDVGETVTDTITVTINGTNDVPTFTGTKTQSTNGVGSNVVVELPLTISELSDGHEYENNGTLLSGFWEGVWDDGSQLEMSVEFLSTTHSSGEPVVTNYQISNPEHRIIYQKGGGYYSILAGANDSDLDYLAAGESYTDTFRISASDIHGATATQDFQIIVNGANDAPVLQVERETISETTNNIANDTGTTVTTSVSEFFGRDGALSTINEIISTTDGDGGTESQSIVDTVKAAHIAALTDGNASSSETYENTNYPYAQHPDAQFHTYSTTEHNVNFDLDGTYANGSVVVWNRSNGFVSSRDRINGTTVELFHSGNSVWTSAALNRTQEDSDAKITVTPPSNIQFDQVRLNFPANSQNLREVQIFGAEVTASGDAGASQTATVVENTTAVLDFTGTDVDTSDTLAYSISGTDADDFTIDINTGELSFTSAPDYETPTDDDTDNVYNLTVTVSDGIATDSTDVSVTVTDVNEPPTAADDTIEATAGHQAVGTFTPFLLNDSDPESDPLTITAFETGSLVGNGNPGTVGSDLAGTYGTLTLYSDGIWSFRADADHPDVLALGPDDAPLTETFTYTISDGTSTDTATITVNVSGVNDAPVVSPITETRTEDDDPFVIDLTAGQSDPDGDTLSVSGTPTITAVDGNNNSYTLPANTASVSGNNLTVDPTQLNGLDDGESVVITVTYDVSDGTTTTQNTATVTVTGANDAPVVGAVTVTETKSENDSSFVVSLIAGQTDPDGDTLSVSGTPTFTAVDGNGTSYTLPANTASVSGNNLTVDPTQLNGLDDGESVVITVTYNVSDGTATTQNTATVTVTGVNDAPTLTGRFGGISSSENILTEDEIVDQHSAENDYTHTTSMYINFVDADGDALTVSKVFDSYTVSIFGTNTVTPQDYSRHSSAPYGDLTATIQETTSNDGGEWRVNLTYTVEDSDLDILQHRETVNQIYTISVSDGTASFSTQLRVQLSGQLDIYVEDDFATVNEGSSISVGNGQSSALVDAKFTSANSPLIIDTFYDGHVVMGGYGRFFEGISFNNDGTKMYLSDEARHNSFDSIIVHNQYTLSTPYDISTATPDDKRLETHQSSTYKFGVLEFNNDGTKAFNIHRRNATGNHDNHIVEFNLTSPYDIDTATQVNEKKFDRVTDFAFNQDGTKFFYLANGWHSNNQASPGDSRLFQYDLSTPYDLDTATNSVTLNNGSGDVLILPEAHGNSPSFELSPDGRKLFLSSESGENKIFIVHEYLLNTPFDISSASKMGSVEYPAVSDSTNNSPTAIKFNNDGSKVYFLNRKVNNTYTNTNYEDVHEYNAQVPFSQFYQVGGHSGDVLNNDRGTNNQITSVRTGSVEGSGDEGTLGQSLDGAYGALTLHADGSYTYVANSDIDGLDENEVVYDQFYYTAEDASGDSDIGVITITINGINSNTPPTVETAAVDPSIDEAVDASSQDLLASGTITFADDSDTDLTISGATSTLVTTGAGVSIPSIAMQIALEGAISVTDNGDNTATWQLDASGLDLDFLDEGETITLEYAVTAEDDDGETVTDNVTVTITGTNDAPIAVDDTGNVEVGTEFSGNVLTSSMGGEDVELDAGDSFQVDRLTGFGTAQVISNTPGSSATAVGTYGTITLSEDGSVTYNADQAAAIALPSGQPSVSETFNYRISDTAGETGTGTITFTISGVNDAPAVNDDNGTPDDASDDIANAATVSTGEDTPHTFGADDFNFTDNDTDDTLASVTITSLPDKGTLTLNGAEVTLDTPIAVADLANLVYTPVDNENGDGYTSFAYTVSDGELDSPAATMTINVTPVNDAPIAADDTSNILVGSEYIGNVLSAQMGGEDTDPDGVDTLTVSALGDTPIEDNLGASASVVGTYGTLVLGRDGSVTYNADQPAAAALNYGDDAVTDTFTYTVSDGNGGSDTATVTFSVTAPNPGNTPPTSADNTLYINEDASLTFARDQFSFSDPDGDILRQITFVSIPDNGSLILGGRTINAGDTITAGQIGDLSYSPATNENGSDYTSFTFRVNDGEVDSVDAYTMNIDILPVNDAPTALDNLVTIEEDATKSFSAAEFGFADIDDSDSLHHITIATLPTNGTLMLSGAPVSAGDNIAAADIGNLVYTPVADANGAPYADFNFTVNDGAEDSADTYTMTVNVTPLNDAPKVIDNNGTPDDASDDVESVASISTVEDVDRSIGVNDLNFTDIDLGDSFASVTITILPSAGTLIVDGVALTNDNLATLGANITAAQLANNELVFRPEPGNSGDNYANFNFTVSDGQASSTAATMTVDVTPENDAPVVVAITDSKTEDDTAFNTDLLLGQSDPEGDDLSIASPIITAEDNNGNTLTLPDGAASVSGNELRIDPTLFNGLDDAESAVITVTYDVSDGALSEQNTATITITGVNDAPTITPLTNANSKDDPNYRFDLLQGAEDLDGDTVSISGTPEIVFTDKDGNEVPLPAGAAALIDNEVEISPSIFSSLDVGEDVFITVNYDITDGDETVSNSATITISGDNTPPQIIDDNGTIDTSDDIEGVASIRVDEDTPHDFTSDDFNFADENEGDTLARLTILSLPEKGTLLLDGNPISAGDAIEASQIGNLTYVPAENDHGDDYANFTYSVNDGTDDSPIGTMAIHVNAVNDLPTSVDAHLPLNGQDEVPLSADNFAFADADGGDLDKVIIVTAPTEGILFLNDQPMQDGDEIRANQLGRLSYKPGEDASGENYDAFTFKVNDGEADSANSYTMSIGVNAPPVAAPSSVSVTEGRPADGTLDVTDPDDTDLTYRITRQPEHGTVRLIDGGPDYIYTPDDHYHGSDTFKFDASDGSQTSDEAEVSLTIAPVNNAPIERLTVGPQVIMVDGKVKPIKLRDFFGDVDAFDPDKPRFQKNVANLYEKGTYPTGAKFDDIPPEGDLTFTVESELPPGLTFNGENISGRPTEPGVYDIVMKATDGLGLSALSSFKMFVGMPITDVTIEPPKQDPEPRDDSKPEETAPDLNDHDLPKVLKVNPKRDGSVPTRSEITAEVVSDDNPVSDMGDNAGLSDDGWMDTKVSSEQDVSGNIRVVDLQVKGDEFAVQIADEAVDRAENFKGEMADGSNLPDWVNVDPDTGLTTATPPEGAKPIEMRIIAADSSGNERAIDLVLNPEAVFEVEQDEKPTREERREARQERREARQAERQARIEAREERRAERAEKRAFREFSRNNSEVSVLSDGRVRFTDGLTAAGEGAMKLMRMVTSPEAVTIEIADEMRGDTTRYEVRQKDGSDVPDWVQVDAATGELVIEATENVSMLELTLIAVDGNNQRSIELEINLDEMNEEGEATEEDLEATDEIEAGNPAKDSEPGSSFTPLDDQIDAALTNNNYGHDLQTAMQTRV